MNGTDGMTWLYYATFDTLIVGAAMMVFLLGFVIAVCTPGSDRWSKRFFIAYFLVLILYGSLTIVEGFMYFHPSPKLALEIIYYFSSLLCSLLLLMITAYFLHCCGEPFQGSTLFRTAAILWICFFIMLNIAPFTDWFYYVTPENQLGLGSLYPLMILAMEATLLLDLAYVIRWRSRLSREYYYAFLIGIFPMTVAMLIHMFVPVFMFFGITLGVSAITMLGIILSDQVRQNMRQQREIAHQRASIMVLQMRPHFIYNTMMSIYYLCKQDPDLAQQVTLDFTTYLRRNFTAIASEELIPFSEELEHTRAYLAVEQAQFEDSLFVDYDTPHLDFRLPPLTLQPIVENAVKHGMDPDSEPLHILIRTGKTKSGSEMTVENTGGDFAPADDSEPHIALQNIQQRLEMMCGGKLTIMPRDGGGTVVKVTIP